MRKARCIQQWPVRPILGSVPTDQGWFSRSAGRLAFLAVLVASPLLFAGTVPPRTVKIPDGTTLRVTLTEELSSATNHANDPVHFEAADDVRVGDAVVIAKGATGIGHILQAQPKGRLGKGGVLDFALEYVKAVDGTNVRLRGTSAANTSGNAGAWKVGLTAGFKKGKDVNVAKGTAIDAYVDGDHEISLSAHPAPVATPAIMATPQQVAPDQLASVVIKSTPDGADITVDAAYVGSTPSTVKLAPGDHLVKVEKPGYKPWQRMITVSPGSELSINANLEKQ